MCVSFDASMSPGVSTRPRGNTYPMITRWSGGRCARAGTIVSIIAQQSAQATLTTQPDTLQPPARPATSLRPLPHHHHLPRFHGTTQGVRAVRPPHVDLVHRLGLSQAEVAARIVSAEERVPRGDITDLGPAGGLDRDARADRIRLALAALGRNREPGADSARVVQQAWG